MQFKNMLSASSLIFLIFLIFWIFFSPTIKIVGLTDESEKTQRIGGTPPYYEGHDDQIEPNPNKQYRRLIHGRKQ